MCLIALAWKTHPRLPLVLVANRDESYERPTAALDAWPERPHILAGRDLSAGGTWLGISTTGRLAAVTNVRQGLAAPPLRSRGLLASDFLDSARPAMDWAAALEHDAAAFGAFNLLLWDGRGLVYASNRPRYAFREIAPGVHALSNASLDTPWPKTLNAAAALGRWIAGPAEDSAPLFEAFADPVLVPQERLPDTGVPLALEQALSPAFIRMPGYGTRSTSVVRVDADGGALFQERTHGPAEPGVLRERHLSLSLPG